MTAQSEIIAFDPATLAKALTVLTKEAAVSTAWQPVEEPGLTRQLQARLLAWYDKNWQQIEELQGLKSKSSASADVLNAFLQDNGFPAMFRPISRGGVGAAAILDMLVRWAVKADLTRLITHDRSSNEKRYLAFEIPKPGFELFDVPELGSKLVKLNTQDGTAVWLTICDRPQRGLDLADLAIGSLAARVPADTQWVSSVIAPVVGINTTVNIAWMLGVHAEGHRIDQAFQVFKLHMDQEGAQVKTATGLATARGMAPKPLRFDRPFAGWLTQPGSEIPIAAFYAAENSWQTTT